MKPLLITLFPSPVLTSSLSLTQSYIFTLIKTRHRAYNGLLCCLAIATEGENNVETKQTRVTLGGVASIVRLHLFDSEDKSCTDIKK